ncbi:hypothetical protein [Streptomyces sp. NPDC086182]
MRITLHAVHAEDYAPLLRRHGEQVAGVATVRPPLHLYRTDRGRR